MKLPRAKHCENCAKLYQPKHAKSRFCSDLCRVQWNRKKKKVNFDEPKRFLDVHINLSLENALKRLKKPIQLRCISECKEDAELMENILLQVFYPIALPSAVLKGRSFEEQKIQYFDINKK